MNLPRARMKDILIHELKDEVLIYDLSIDKFYCLNSTASIVFNHCDGSTTFADLASRYKLTESLIYFTLDELKKQNLLGANASYISPLSEMSRREAVKRVGLGSMAALPLVTALIAPPAARAASSCTANTTACVVNETCCSGACVTTLNNSSQVCCYGSGAYLSQGFTGTSTYSSAADCQNSANLACCNRTATVNSFDPGTGNCNITCT